MTARLEKMGVGAVGKQRMALLASIGPMGLGAIDYVPHCGRRPSLLVDTVLNLTQIPGGKN